LRRDWGAVELLLNVLTGVSWLQMPDAVDGGELLRINKYEPFQAAAMAPPGNLVTTTMPLADAIMGFVTMAVLKVNVTAVAVAGLRAGRLAMAFGKVDEEKPGGLALG